MLKNFCRSIAAAAVLAVGAQIGAHATSFNCTGTVANIGLYAGGTVNLSFTSQNPVEPNVNIFLCSINGDTAGISASTCAGWLALGREARAASKQVSLTFIANGSITNCGAIPNYWTAGTNLDNFQLTGYTSN